VNDAEPVVAFTGTVTGRVQGVALRYSALQAARKLGVRGWVRNLPDGRVGYHAEGAERAVASFLTWLEQGPPAARVDALESQSTAQIHADGFEIR
jgi:acylphosphatase